MPHRYVRQVQHQYVHQNRRSDPPPTDTRNDANGNYDATLRANDPHIARINKQSFDKQRAIEQLTQGAGQWQDWNRNGTTEIAYTFKQGPGAFNDAQKHEARRAIQSWGDVANLAFTENGSHTEGKLSFQISNNETTATGFYPGPHAISGDTRYNPNYVTRPTIAHEIGHTLGLTHPGRYDRTASEGQRVYAQDSKAHTVMSYFDARDSGKRLEGRPKAPMMDDISAVQQLYGANHQTRRDNTTYGFNSNSGRDYYSLAHPREAAAFCIWDGGGNDTLDVSGYSNNQVINLKAGSFSDVGGLLGNVSIARGCSIENAIGGAGHDALIGNDANNRLTGGRGGDRLRGGGGADTFVYHHASDSTLEAPDEIMDFTSGLDKIDLSGALRNAGLSALFVVNNWSGKAGEMRLTYDEKSATGTVSIDLTGDGKPDLLIKTHGQVKPQDILPAPTLAPTPPQAGAVTVRPPVVFNRASESTLANARLLTDFASGTDKLDLRAIEKEANTRLTLVTQFTGRIGETLVSYNPNSRRYFVAVDLSGNGSTDFLVKSTHLIKPKDILVNP
ncbi:MAG: M10 family metallopeptidase C-terminal domain-containing protein [Pseudomonas sp.]|uniref:M10 family metallopeptidase C-terminal domain-containing protein n=1 Tax=Pseudomonas sp. TaxID=306 RepID=UPI00391D08E0